MTAPIPFGLNVPQPNITVGSKEIVRSVAGAPGAALRHGRSPAQLKAAV